jgi:putative spermidine/putrescine transport system permease protein
VAIWLQRAAILLVGFAVALMLIGPLIVVIGASMTETAYAVFPPQGLTWHWYAMAIRDSDYYGPGLLSFGISIVSAAIDTTIAISLGLGLEVVTRRRISVKRHHGIFISTVRVLALSPVMFPRIVTAVALLTVFISLGLDGSVVSILVAHIILIFPFIFVLVEAGLANAPDHMRRSAESLGASATKTFWHITLPLARTGIGAAFAIGFVISIGEVTVDVFLQGPNTVTLPVYLFNAVNDSPLTSDLSAASGIIAVGTVGLMLAAAISLAVLRRSSKTG